MQAITPKESIKRDIAKASQIFTAKKFIAETVIEGIDAQGEPFVHTIYFDETDTEFIKMLNDYGARKAVKLL